MTTDKKYNCRKTNFDKPKTSNCDKTCKFKFEAKIVMTPKNLNVTKLKDSTVYKTEQLKL